MTNTPTEVKAPQEFVDWANSLGMRATEKLGALKGWNEAARRMSAALSAEREKREKAEGRCMRLEHKLLNPEMPHDELLVYVEDAHDTWDLGGTHYVCGCPCQCPKCLTNPPITEEEK